MNKSSAFNSAPRSLATDAEKQLSRYDAEIAEVTVQLRAVDGVDSDDARQLRERGAQMIAVLQRGRSIAALSAEHIWEATLLARCALPGGAA
jgi:hypothetical protein